MSASANEFRAQLAVPCDRCGAGAGEQCTTDDRRLVCLGGDRDLAKLVFWVQVDRRVEPERIAAGVEQMRSDLGGAR